MSETKRTPITATSVACCACGVVFTVADERSRNIVDREVYGYDGSLRYIELLHVACKRHVCEMKALRAEYEVTR